MPRETQPNGILDAFLAMNTNSEGTTGTFVNLNKDHDDDDV